MRSNPDITSAEAYREDVWEEFQRYPVALQLPGEGLPLTDESQREALRALFETFLRERCITHIRKAWNYNATARSYASCNHMYMGSMTSHRLSVILGVDVPFRRVQLEKVVTPKLTEAAGYLNNYAFPWERVSWVKLPEEKEGTKP